MSEKSVDTSPAEIARNCLALRDGRIPNSCGELAGLLDAMAAKLAEAEKERDKARRALLTGQTNPDDGTLQTWQQNAEHQHAVFLMVKRRAEAAEAERDAALAQLAEARRENEWRPIESAPKDGSDILTIGLDSNSVITTRWISGGPFTRTPMLNYYRPEGWYWSSYGGDPIGPVSPTHWRPLPSPPPSGKDERMADILKQFMSVANARTDAKLADAAARAMAEHCDERIAKADATIATLRTELAATRALLQRAGEGLEPFAEAHKAYDAYSLCVRVDEFDRAVMKKLQSPTDNGTTIVLGSYPTSETAVTVVHVYVADFRRARALRDEIAATLKEGGKADADH